MKAHTANKTDTTATINATIATAAVGNATKSAGKVLQEREKFTMIYLFLILFGVLSFLTRSFSFYYLCLRIATNLHDMIFRSVSRAKMVFFNANPSGRILNRFAKDLYRVDSLLPMFIIDVIDVSEMTRNQRRFNLC